MSGSAECTEGINDASLCGAYVFAEYKIYAVGLVGTVGVIKRR